MNDHTLYNDDDVGLSLPQHGSEVLQSEITATVPQDDQLESNREEDDSGVKLWYPDADRSVSMVVRGNYGQGYPVGAVVHFTAGRSERGDRDAEQTMTNGRSDGYLYFCMSATGKVYQPAPLNKWGSHCGASSYPGLGTSLANKLTGIEICRAGWCEQTDQGFAPWWNEEYPPGSPKRTFYSEAEMRKVTKQKNITKAGYYHAYTAQQEASLHKLLLWLHLNNPAVFKIANIVGHDEISPDRKNDPGGALSEFMDDLRVRIARMAAEAVA